MDGSGGGRVVRASLGTVLLVSLIWFLFICILANQVTEEKAVRTISSTRNLNVLTFIGSKQHPLHLRGSPKLITVSKRRVPNGPDPIHNRYDHISLFTAGKFFLHANEMRNFCCVMLWLWLFLFECVL